MQSEAMEIIEERNGEEDVPIATDYGEEDGDVKSDARLDVESSLLDDRSINRYKTIFNTPRLFE